MGATQLQIHRGNEVATSLFTGGEGEITYDIDTKRARLHDGVTAGGVLVPNSTDMIGDTFNYALATGTANALIIQTAFNPVALVVGARLRVKIALNNTGAVTIAWGVLGATTVKKYVEGVKLPLAENDLVMGRIHDFHFDGVDYVITSLGIVPGLESVSQGDLNTSTGTVSTILETLSTIVLPGGEYGFYPQIKHAASNAGFANEASIAINSKFTASYTCYIALKTYNSIFAVSARQRYVTSSPPFNMGDGDAGGFIFLLLNKAGEAVSVYTADVPPWGYNGKTNIRADVVNKKNGKKYRKTVKKRTLEQILDGAQPEHILEEITQEIKNRDMGDIPHPFGVVLQDHKVVMLDPSSDKVKNLIDHQNIGSDELNEALHKGMIYADNSALNRKGPNGVMQVNLMHKKTAKTKKKAKK